LKLITTSLRQQHVHALSTRFKTSFPHVPVFFINPEPKQFTSHITCSTGLGKGMCEGPESKFQPGYKQSCSF